MRVFCFLFFGLAVLLDVTVCFDWNGYYNISATNEHAKVLYKSVGVPLTLPMTLVGKGEVIVGWVDSTYYLQALYNKKGNMVSHSRTGSKVKELDESVAVPQYGIGQQLPSHFHKPATPATHEQIPITKKYLPG